MEPFDAPVVVLPGDKPAPLAERLSDALADAAAFERYKRDLLDPARHYVVIGGRPRVNSAGWNHLAAALRVSVVLLSQHTDGTPGTRREILEGLDGNRFIAYSATARASRQSGSGVVEADRTGRTESSESSMKKKQSKGVLTEDFLEVMAVDRAKNRAICALLGGASTEVADDAEATMESNTALREDKQPLGFLALFAEAEKRGLAKSIPEFLVWLKGNVPSCADLGPDSRKTLTRGESLRAMEILGL